MATRSTRSWLSLHGGAAISAALSAAVVVCVLAQPTDVPGHASWESSFDKTGYAASPHRPAPKPVTPRAEDYSGPGFDTCSAPSIAALRAWKATTAYRALGVYIGGANRACGYGNLSASWVRQANALGWRLAPLYVGLQAPCVKEHGLALIDPKAAGRDGKNSADDALDKAAALGLGKGSPIYLDLEAYRPKDQTCTREALEYIEAWVAELRRHQYRAGVYASGNGAVGDLASAQLPAGLSPDALWLARWDGKTDTVDPVVPASMWSHRQRIKQFTSGHKEKHGGVTINIDSDYFNGPIARIG